MQKILETISGGSIYVHGIIHAGFRPWGRDHAHIHTVKYPAYDRDRPGNRNRLDHHTVWDL